MRALLLEKGSIVQNSSRETMMAHHRERFES